MKISSTRPQLRTSTADTFTTQSSNLIETGKHVFPESRPSKGQSTPAHEGEAVEITFVLRRSGEWRMNGESWPIFSI